MTMHAVIQADLTTAKRFMRGLEIVGKPSGKALGNIQWVAREGLISVIVKDGGAVKRSTASDVINHLANRGVALTDHGRGLLVGYIAAKLEA